MSSSSNLRIFVCSIFLTTDAMCFHYFHIVYSTALSGFLISSFISLHSLNALFTKTNSSWLIYKSIKVLEIKTLIVFNLVFANKTILSCFFFFFLMIDLLFNFCSDCTNFKFYYRNRNTYRTPTNEANAEIETQPLAAETTTKALHTFLYFSLIKSLFYFI